MSLVPPKPVDPEAEARVHYELAAQVGTKEAWNSFVEGGWMTLARLLRCHPWGNSGLDYVPDVPPRDARWYLPWRYGRWRGPNPARGQDPVN